MLWFSRRSVVAILKLLIPKSLFNTNSLLFFGSMDFDSLKLYGAIFISDGAVNALYHASKQYYDNAIAYKCKDLKIRRVWHCLILTLSYLKTKFLQHTSPGSKETYIGLVGARSRPGWVGYNRPPTVLHVDAVHPGISTGALFLPVGPGPTLYHEISSHNEISSQQLYNYTTVQHFTTIYPFLLRILFTFIIFL